MQELLIARDGTAGLTYIGHCKESYNEIKEDMLEDQKTIELLDVYTFQVLMIPVAPGRIEAQPIVSPLDAALAAQKSVTIRLTSCYPAEGEGKKRLLALIAECEASLVKARSGLITGGGAQHG